jgi:predicted sulfurtransferase
MFVGKRSKFIMKDFRLPLGSSDPVAFTCTCAASSSPNGGIVLLFYRYFSAPPLLASSFASQESGPSTLAAFHEELTQRLHLGGKIRVAKEGFNITIGGSKDEIEIYIKECISHWSFSGLELSTEEKKRQFFKPTTGGCACVFGGLPASVRVTAEITSMGVTNYTPKDWDIVESLEPAEFHERCWRDKRKLIVDVRNHYESRIGYFVDPRTGEKAVTPAIRRFSQWPQYVKTHLNYFEVGAEGKGREIMTYCTGGIRCEKGVRFLSEKLGQREGDKISTLKGGIAAYLMWMDEEIKQGRKRPEDSLFQGKNYVFDARGSTGLIEGSGPEPVASCDVCKLPSDRLSKCRSRGCHLIMVVCSSCEDSKDPRCCSDCLELDLGNLTNENIIPSRPRPICACEKEREAMLWRQDRLVKSKGQGWRKEQRSNGVDALDIRITTID